MLQLALVAPRPVPPKQTVTRTQDRSRNSRFLIQASRTLSEKPVIINRGKNPTGVGSVVVGQAPRLPAVIPSATEAVALQTRWIL
jgi:hypothetical protein